VVNTHPDRANQGRERRKRTARRRDAAYGTFSGACSPNEEKEEREAPTWINMKYQR